MPNIFFVRSNYGTYTPQFLKGGYVGIGWLVKTDLSHIITRDELYPLYKKNYPEDISNIVIGQQVGQISRFLLEIQKNDYVLSQSVNSDHIHYGIVTSDYYYDPAEADGCPYPHRKKIKWIDELPRSAFSVPFQNTIRSSLSVFYVSQTFDFFNVIDKPELAPLKERHSRTDYHKVILERVLELDATEFELLITHLLAAIGFEAEHTGRSGDGGVDAKGELDIAGMAKIKVFVQAKRYQPDKVIRSSYVKALRQSIPRDGQGTFITTAQYDKHCKEIALDSNFQRIGLINGNQFVDLLTEHWEDIPDDFQKKLGLKKGLVLA
jgi:predicted Mrr-cat superfamily restriction endonuclease